MLKILQAPHPVLSKKAEKIGKIDKKIHSLIEEMAETLENMHDPEGVGLAAPQVGEPLQLFIIKEWKEAPLLTFINPVIDESSLSMEKKEKPKKKKKEKDVQLEGCLSLYNVWGIVNRSPKVTLTYIDEQGKEHTKEFKGFLATIIQHECDHLEGILFPRRVLEQKEQLYKSSKDEHGENVFEEITI